MSPDDGASWLYCLDCAARLENRVLAASCACGGEFAVGYQPGDRTAGGPGIFRFASRLPVAAPELAISLGEGDTPLLDVDPAMPGRPAGAAARAGTEVGRLRVKCEFLNPTGSFKDRIAAVAATIMAERSIGGCVGTSSGNGGAAMAAYAARAGRLFTVFALADIVPQKLIQIRAAGGRVMLLEGLGHDAAATELAATTIVAAALARGVLPFITAARFSPEAMEGAKTIAYELAEQAPEATAVYVPIGGGGLFSAIGRGYRELAADLPGGLPRLVAVQPRGCATISGVLGGQGTMLAGPAETAISGLQVPVLFDARQVALTMASSGGHHVEVGDDEVSEHQALLAREGILVEPAGAAALAAVSVDLRRGALGPDDDVIVIGTGAGYKDEAALRRLAPAEDPETCGTQDIQSVLSKLGGPRDD